MSLLADILSWLLLLGGSAIMVISGIGVVRLPDCFTRLHAAGLADTLGAILLIAGLAVQSGLTLVGAKLALILVFLLFTSPIASHALANAALRGGIRPVLHEKDPER